MKKKFRSWKRWAFALVIMVVLFSCASLIAGCEKERSWQIGARTPEISVLDLNDQMVKLSAFL